MLSKETEAALTALRRARIRLRYHGWRQGARKQKTGSTLREAVVGRNTQTKPTEAEQLAVAMLANTIAQGAELQGPPEALLDGWNEEPLRTIKDALGLIDETMRAAQEPEPEVATSPVPLAAPEPFSLAQYQMPGSDDQEGEL